MAAAALKPRRRRRTSCMSSCFGVSTESDGDEDDNDGRGPSLTRKILGLFSWLRLGKKKKTVIVVALPESPGEGHEEMMMMKIKRSPETPVEKSSPTKSPLATIKTDVNSKSNKRYHHRLHHQAPITIVESYVKASPKKSCILHISSKCDTQSQLALLHQMCDSTHTGTTTSHHAGSLESNHTQMSPKKHGVLVVGKLDSNNVLLVLAMTLTTLILFGHAPAIVCVSAWFYLMPWRRRTTASLKANSSENKNSPELKDANSKEYKKKVVLQGLLERNKRKLSRSATAPGCLL